MQHTPMPEPMRRAVSQMVYEAVERCQEVLSYAASDVARDWKRMTLYRATDAADTMNMVSMLIAAYCEQVGVDPETLDGYLQLSQQENRADGPQEDDRAHLAGLLGQKAPAGASEPGSVRMLYGRGQRQAEAAQQPEEPSSPFPPPRPPPARRPPPPAAARHARPRAGRSARPGTARTACRYGLPRPFPDSAGTPSARR
ncbi:hypothetical protein [Streptomyces sp. SP18CS02]|uniref:hypothetical protein n=1 Tax=Streptomyces sp. SP18CS02 TaxID=3002531 RepID=UPI002E7792F8|nr:hypothetical protein [Streptomyces sp. SP18CS02]MEE1751184.1 hypothetical protein [Streptomyces sp. SP18CS02]